MIDLLALFPFRVVHVDTIDGLKQDAVHFAERMNSERQRAERAEKERDALARKVALKKAARPRKAMRFAQALQEGRA